MGRRRFNKIEIKIKSQPNLKVRTRSGFYGVASEEIGPTLRRTREEQIMSALTSPIATGEIPLRLTSLFGNEAQTGSFARSLLHIDVNKMTFTKEADGWHKAVMDIIAITYGDSGRIIDIVNRTETMRARDTAYEQLQREGFIYYLNVPIKKAGAYQLRAAVRDTATERTGSASQFIEIPNLGKNRLALSGIVVSGQLAAATNRLSSSGENQVNASLISGDVASESAREANPAVRRFRRGAVLDYGYQIYNAKLDRSTARPQLQTQLRLFHDGQQVYAGDTFPYNPTGQADLKRLNAAGRLQLGTAMPAGEYVLQVIVTDLLAKGNRRTTTQWIDFEVVK
jgi:hypothetical protein